MQCLEWAHVDGRWGRAVQGDTPSATAMQKALCRQNGNLQCQRPARCSVTPSGQFECGGFSTLRVDGGRFCKGRWGSVCLALKVPGTPGGGGGSETLPLRTSKAIPWGVQRPRHALQWCRAAIKRMSNDLTSISYAGSRGDCPRRCSQSPHPRKAPRPHCHCCRDSRNPPRTA